MVPTSTSFPTPGIAAWSTARPVAARPFLSLGRYLPLLVLHFVLGIVIFRVPGLSTIHAVVVLGLALLLAFHPTRSFEAVYFAGYLASADVLWRMTKATIPWEGNKYALVAISFALLARQGLRRGLGPLALFYVVLLLPSTALTIQKIGISDQLRQELSFNLSGPLSLCACVLLCSGLKQVPDLGRLLGWMILPTVSVFAIAFYSTITASNLIFRNQASFATSGGYGPNQVAAILGLGCLLALLIALNVDQAQIRWLFLGLAAALQIQNFLTFSRGGTFNLIIALLLLAVHTIAQARARRIFLGIFVGGFLLAVFLVLPQLNAWTAGGFSQRFTNIDTTGRKSLAEADIELFKKNPFLGVGPGMSRYERTDVARIGVASHTELTRLLAEHGVLGVLALAVLLFVAFQAYVAAPSTLTKGWVAVMASWSFAEMTHSAMRIAAISFVFGLALLVFRRPVSQEGSASS